MTRRTALWIAWIAGLVLVALHLDYYRAGDGPLRWGWVPDELAWRVGSIGLAWAYILFVCRYVWREDDA
ncbi:MAG: hypothetical protein ACYTG1_09865 [Planctomycetota bacterium]